jgi:hypothetical protein
LIAFSTRFVTSCPSRTRSLWSVWDASAADVADAVYAELIRDAAIRPDQTPEALHRAVRELRASAPGRPSTWAPFLHIGP